MSGLNRYTSDILSALLHSPLDPVICAATPVARERFGDAARIVPLPRMRRSDFIGNSLRLAWNQVALPSVIRRERASLYYSPVAEGMLAPTVPQVITLHDLLPIHFPDSYPRLRYYFRFVVPRLVRASTAVIVDSRSTERDLRNWLRGDDTPVHVIYPGYNRESFRLAEPAVVERVRAAHGLGDYILAVGETRPYKNIRRLIEAFAKLRSPVLDLVIVGKKNRMDPTIVDLPRSLGIEARVRFLGYVPDEELAALYGGARAFVFPSLYEGFGIPPLEAMACGCPVIASNAASIPEVCGDAAVYVDPTSTESIAREIARVVGDGELRAALRERGLVQARKFSAEQAAREVVGVLDGIVGMRARGKRLTARPRPQPIHRVAE